jgi:hypothetical protein
MKLYWSTLKHITVFPNVDISHNLLRYSTIRKTWHDIFIPEGSYELADINKSTEQQMKQNVMHYAIWHS